MKRCPECRRDYYDDTLSFCLDDGSRLLDGPASGELTSTIILPLVSDVGFGPEPSFEPATEVFQTIRAPRIETQNSIAVLPLVNMSADPDNEYFCDGLSEELIHALARVDDLKVVARTSAFAFKGKNVDVAQIASVLNVQNIVEGSVRKFGDRMRITMQLVNAADGYHVWSDRYETEMEDIFEVQDKITRSVVNALKTKLLGRERSEDEMMASLIQELRHSERDVEAYQLYLRGRFFLNKFTTADFYRALECFDKAITIDPGFAEAWSGLADTHIMLTEMGPVPSREGMPKAKESALKALSLNDRLSEAHSSLGLVLQDYEYDFRGAEREFVRAIELNSNNSSARQFYGQLLAQLGRHAEAETQLIKALEVDPLSVVGHWIYGFAMFEARRYDDCIAQTRKALQIDPNFPAAFLNIAFAEHLKGNYEASVESYAKFSELCGSVETAGVIRGSYQEGGWEGFLRTMTSPNSPVNISEYIVAVFSAALGDKDSALSRLESSLEAREPHIVMVKIDPRFDELRTDPRFQDLIKNVGFPE